MDPWVILSGILLRIFIGTLMDTQWGKLKIVNGILEDIKWGIVEDPD